MIQGQGRKRGELRDGERTRLAGKRANLARPPILIITKVRDAIGTRRRIALNVPGNRHLAVAERAVCPFPVVLCRRVRVGAVCLPLPIDLAVNGQKGAFQSEIVLGAVGLDFLLRSEERHTRGVAPWNLTLMVDPFEYEPDGAVRTLPNDDPMGTLSKTTPV